MWCVALVAAFGMCCVLTTTELPTTREAPGDNQALAGALSKVERGIGIEGERCMPSPRTIHQGCSGAIF
jgi:hypothetical protein